MMRTVYLEGELATKFGEKFEIFAASPRDVFRCLNANFSNFRKYMIDCHEKNIAFTCEIAGNQLDKPEELFLNYGTGDMILSPVPAGSKGVGKIIVAIAIVVASIYIPGFKAFMYTMTEAGAITGFTIGGGIVMSATLMLANMGVAEMMAPDPLVDKTRAQEDNYLFQGAGQVGRAGDPVPLLYGQLRVPGKPIGMNIANVANSLRVPFHDPAIAETSGETTSSATRGQASNRNRRHNSTRNI